jgi:Ca2+/Na+ antiporter
LGAGVVIGSNIFNLAALLGLGAVVAGRIVLHRKVVALLTALTLALAYAGRGLGRWAGWVIIAGYAAFVVAVFIAS